MVRNLLRTLVRDCRAAQAVELAFVLPVLIIMTFGVIDFGRLLFELNGAQKAAQWGAQTAITRDSVALPVRDYFRCRLSDTSLVGENCLTPTGELREACNFGIGTCTEASCGFEGGFYNGKTVPAGDVNWDANAWGQIVQRMQASLPTLRPSSIEIQYRPSGLGFVGRPTPVTEVTATVKSHNFRFLMLPIFGLFPDGIDITQSVTLTTEDLSDNACWQQGLQSVTTSGELVCQPGAPDPVPPTSCFAP